MDYPNLKNWQFTVAVNISLIFVMPFDLDCNGRVEVNIVHQGSTAPALSGYVFFRGINLSGIISPEVGVFNPIGYSLKVGNLLRFI